MKKYILTLFVLSLLGWMACSEEPKPTAETASGLADYAGELIFKQYCVNCHGIDGKLGLNGAKNLGLSVLSQAERVLLITNGKGNMTAFGGVIAPEEIEAVATYTLSFIDK